MNFIFKYKNFPVISVILAFSLFYLYSAPIHVNAQSDSDNPVYIVQDGDTPGLIVSRFGISIDDLMAANGITDPNSISVGTELIIPGLTGVHGKLMSEIIPFGDSLNSLSVKYKIPREQLALLNNITSPCEIYAYSNLVLPQREDSQPLSPAGLVKNNQSLLEVAVLSGANPWTLAQYNQMDSTWNSVPGETIFTQNVTDIEGENLTSVSAIIKSFDVSPFIIVQGSTLSFKITTAVPVDISGSFSGRPLNFFQDGENQYAALQGVYAKADAGLSPVQIYLTPVDTSYPRVGLEQMLLITQGSFGMEAIVVDPITIDPTYTEPEEEQVFAIIGQTTPQKLWADAFIYPVDEPICIQSYYGTRRSYNDSPYSYFHTGLDFGVCAPNLNIYTPAPGKVVFSGPLVVRGNAVIVDHGWGIFSGFYHMKEINVSTGDMLETGQLVGLIGATGRVTGPHLHYDLFVNGIQIEPFNWFGNYYP